jgi:hypothetical protein
MDAEAVKLDELKAIVETLLILPLELNKTLSSESCR